MLEQPLTCDSSFMLPTCFPHSPHCSPTQETENFQEKGNHAHKMQILRKTAQTEERRMSSIWKNLPELQKKKSFFSTKDDTEVIKKMKVHFARYWIPEKLTIDNGPPFKAHEFEKFAQTYGFEHVTSSGYPVQQGSQKCSKTCQEHSGKSSL